LKPIKAFYLENSYYIYLIRKQNEIL